jgi:protein gp37
LDPFEFGFDLRIVPEKLADPIRWPKPKKIFVNSMSDLFHEGVSDDYIEKVCRVMLAANWHTYQVLTKRADRMATLLRGKLRAAALRIPAEPAFGKNPQTRVERTGVQEAIAL